MATRITTQFQTNTFINQLFAEQNSIQTLNTELTTGYKVLEPSDAPGAAATITDYSNTISRLSRQKDRIGYAQDMLSSQETAMSTAQDTMTRANEIASQAANETLSATDRQNLSAEVWSLRDEMVDLANTKINGKYIYGGDNDATPPVTALSGASGYANPPTGPDNIHYTFSTAPGESNTRNVQVTDDETVRVNTDAGTMFQNSIDSLERLGRALDGYRTTPEGSSAPPVLSTSTGVFNQPTDFHDQTSAIQSSIDQLTTANTAFSTEQSDLGARENRLTQAGQLIDGVSSDTTTDRSQLQDSDIADIASKLTSLQTSYQALLVSGSQINKLSLLNYIT